MAKAASKNCILPAAAVVFLLSKSPLLFLEELSRETFYTGVFTHGDLCPFYKLISGVGSVYKLMAIFLP